MLGSRSNSWHKSNQSGRCVSGLDEVTTFENGFLSRLVACRFASKRKSKLDCNLKGSALQGGVIEISHETHIPHIYLHSCLCRCEQLHVLR